MQAPAHGLPHTGRDSNCYHLLMLEGALREKAREAEALMTNGRLMMVRAIREASAAGMTQRDIARAIGRSQPEVNRLLRFHGTSTNARTLRKHRSAVTTHLKNAGLLNPRVFGSTARETDGPNSDIDLLVTPTAPMGLLAQARLERELEGILGVPVDLVFETNLRPDIKPRVLEEAIPL